MLDRKHIRAPRSFDPGKGLPRERLAYLSDAEMEALRLATDGTVSRGPRGIPSFAVTSGKDTGTTMGGGERTSSNPSGGGPGGPFGANSGPSKASTASGVTGGGGKGTSQNSSPKSPSGPSGPNSGQSTSKAAPSSAPAASPSRSGVGPATSPASPMGGQGTSFGTQAAARGFNAGVTARNQETPSSPMGGQKPSFGSPAAAAAANRAVAGAIKGGQNPSGSPRASAMSKPQVDAYTDFGQRMAAAPRQPEVPRSPGDAEQLGRMGVAENGLIRDPVTGKMTELANQGTLDVIRNRMENQNLDVQGVISQKAQFSPWGDGTYAGTAPDPARTAMAEAVLRGVTPDYTSTPAMPQGADFYHNADTVKKDKGYQRASATTKARISDNFVGGLSVDDGLGGPWGHVYGVSADGTLATPRGPQKMGEPRHGATSYGTGRVAAPERLPQGALSQDPNYGGLAGGPPAAPRSDHVPGRFGGLRPDVGSSVAKIGYDVSQYPATSPEAARFATAYQPDRWERDVGFLAGRTIAPTREEAALEGYANPYSAVDPRLIEGGAAMIRDAEAATGSQATINDAYRSEWHQAVGAPAKKGQKASPGKSWHQAGTAIDVGAGPVQNYLNANRRSLGDYGMVKPESMMNPANPDYPHFQVADTPRPFADGIKSGLRPPGGYQVASAVSQEPGAFAAPAYQPDEGGMFRALAAAPGAISGLGRSFKTVNDTLSTPNPAFKTASNIMGKPMATRMAVAAAQQVAPGAVKDAVSEGIRSLKETFDPNNPRARAAAESGYSYTPTSSGVRDEQTSEQRGNRSASGTSKGGGRNDEQGKGGDRETAPGKQPPKGGTKKPIGKKRIEDLAAPATPTSNPWDYFTNVTTKEQALRQLLGEGWYA